MLSVFASVNKLDLLDCLLVFHSAPPTALAPNTRYDKMMEAFGGEGYFCQTPAEIRDSLKAALASDKPSLVNVMIDPMSQRRTQVNWRL